MYLDRALRNEQLGKYQYLAKCSGILFIPEAGLLLCTFWTLQNVICAQHRALRVLGAPSLCRQGLSKPKCSWDAQIPISFMCNFSPRLVNLKQQSYKSCSFVWAGDQVFHRNILEDKKKKKEEEELRNWGSCARAMADTLFCDSVKIIFQR